MNWRSARTGLGLLAATVIVVAACGSTVPSTAPSAAPTPVPSAAASTAPSASAVAAVDPFGTRYAPATGRPGGSLVVGDWREAVQLNPYYLSQVSEANVASLVWHSLLTVASDFRYIPQLAAAPIPTTANGGVKVPGTGGDAMTVTWKIRDGLRWSDGQPLTCDDFRYAWEWVLDKGNVRVATAGFEDITNFECASDTDMIWHFRAVYEGYLTLMTAPLPRHYLARFAMADQVRGAGFGAGEIAQLPVPGPFRYASVTPHAELRLVRNDQYRNPRTGGPANLDGVTFRWYRDAGEMIAGFRTGQVDLAFGLEDPDVPKVKDLGRQVAAVPGLEYEFLRLNWSPATAFDAAKQTGGCSRNPAVADRGKGCPMADPAIRQAIAYAVDKNAIVAGPLGGNVQVANTDVSPSAWFYADQASAAYDPVRAGAILDGAGWAPGPDGIRAKNGVRARIELCTTTDQVRRDTLLLVSGWLKAIGIDSVINAVPTSDIFAAYSDARLDTPCALSRSNFDLAEHAFRTSIDPLGDYFSYHSSQFRPVGANDAQVSDPEIDRALDAVRGNVDFAVVKEAMAAFQKAYVDRTVEIPLYYRRNVELADPRVGNYFANGTSAGSTWNGEDWFLGS